MKLFGLRIGLNSGKGLNGFNKGLVVSERKSFADKWEAYRSGNWNNPQIWRKNGKSTNQIPNNTSRVYINPNISVTVNVNATVYSLYSLGSLIFDSSARTLTVNNDCLIYGVLNMSGSGGTAHNLVMNGYNNFINNSLFTSGTGSIITYGRTSAPSTVLGLTYRNLTIFNGGIKNIAANTNVLGTTTISQVTNVRTDINVSKSVVFTGSFVFGANISGGIYFNSGDIEFKGGISGGGGNTPVYFQNTINSLLFTNTQTVNSGGGNNHISYLCPFNISDTFTITFSGTSPHIFYDVVNGLGAGAILNNNGFIQLNTLTLPMATGTFNYNNTLTSTICFAHSSSFTLPYTSFAGNLSIGGTGVKTVAADTTITGNLTSFDYVLGFSGSGYLYTGSELQLSTFNLTVNGTTANNYVAKLSKNSSTGTTLFVGQLVTTFGGSSCNFNFQNPYEIELRGGLLFSGVVSTGLTFRMTTNNQTYNSRSVGENYNLLIDSVTVTYSTTETVFIGTINGVNSSSIFDNRGTFDYRNDAEPMSTGQLVTQAAANTFIYNKVSLLQVIKVPNGSGYWNLTLTGNTSTKTVGGAGTVNVTNTKTINTGVTVVGTITP